MIQLKPRKHFIECVCHDPEHLAQLVYFPDDEDRVLYLHFHLVTWTGFFRRFWTGIKYAFGYHSRYGHWDEIIIDLDEAGNIIEFLEDFEQNR